MKRGWSVRRDRVARFFVGFLEKSLSNRKQKVSWVTGLALAEAVEYACRVKSRDFRFYSLCRKHQEARTIPGDKIVLQASASRKSLRPERRSIGNRASKGWM